MNNAFNRLGFYLASLLFLSGCQLTSNEHFTILHSDETPSEQSSHEQMQAAQGPSLEEQQAEQARLAQKAEEEAFQAKLQQNLWFELQHSFAWNHPSNKAIQKELKRYLRHRAPLETLNDNAAPHLYFIINELKKRNLPAELALLPHVESNFNPFAYSPGGAAGIWQFMPRTAKHYGLASNWWYEGRRDTIASTKAALDYLEYLANFFDGDWLLAVAAYNAGEGRVKQAVKRNKKRNKPTDFWSLSLPAETRVYVPRLLAMTELVTHPEKYDLQLPELENQPQLAQVNTNGQIELAVAAELADIPLADFHRMNAGFNRWATSPNNHSPLLVPVDKKAQFEQRLAKLPSEKRITWHRYKVKKGDTLNHIASNFNTSTDVLRTVNNIKGSLISIGQPLMIPNGEYRGHAPFKFTSMGQRQGKVVYRVKNGDNLWSIAKKFAVRHKDIARWNGIGIKSLLRPGQQLTIYNKNVAKGTATQYKVKSGDSLYLIAKRFNVSVKKLTDWNKRTLRKYLQPGQILKLYL